MAVSLHLSAAVPARRAGTVAQVVLVDLASELPPKITALRPEAFCDDDTAFVMRKMACGKNLGSPAFICLITLTVRAGRPEL